MIRSPEKLTATMVELPAEREPQGQKGERFIRAILLTGFAAVLITEFTLLWRIWQIWP